MHTLVPDFGNVAQVSAGVDSPEVAVDSSGNIWLEMKRA